MIRWRSLDEVTPGFGPSVVSIGNFDGVHRGHQEVFTRLLDTARERHAQSVVVTFDPHPALVHRPEYHPGLIMGLEDKLDALEETGVDAALVLPYSLEFSELTPEEFLVDYLVRPLRAVSLVLGSDVRLGRNNSGDLAAITDLGHEYGFDVVVVEDVPGTPASDDDAPSGSAARREERRCSSTWVRSCLEAGDIEGAAQLLGRPHRMRGEVVHGAARGRQLGFPTANLAPKATGFIPADGVYAGWLVDQDGTRWPTAISVGSNPTFDGVTRQVEAHVIDRPDEAVEDFDLYGQTVVVEFVERLRGMVAYRGIDALVAQMKDDVNRTRDILRALSRAAD
ncbi:bifunctional riboflavin kinase/FAD synthetase [Kocuria tytonicola]|uniref:Riboflavin biosynthesis protein n=1 Tax=Kocuria tytonicola TaxID=2055946 RepID=A0A3L9KZV6_9MICC|nr:bifunctional riboflavin kinase/FAD synthetase [Kocuria tytonicola]RLY92376.1 bifunctional riboflavin kinase/FAD synthetase [Kocuria tytonicola]